MRDRKKEGDLERPGESGKEIELRSGESERAKEPETGIV